MEEIIRNCLIEFGGNRAGLAWEDASLSQLFDYYNREGRAYWVALDDSGKLLGGSEPLLCEAWLSQVGGAACRV